MTTKNNRQQQAKILRLSRKIHRSTGALLFVFFFVMAITGSLLGWKKNTNGSLLPPTQKGSSSNFKTWLTLDSLELLANQYLQTVSIENKLARVDVRKQKGIAKFVYKKGYWEVQVDGSTGALLSIGRRHSDWLEDLHDGSFLDDYLELPNNSFKLFYTSIMGGALLLFTVTGFWLWYGPKKMRQSQRKA